jgi:hypothetical protein
MAMIPRIVASRSLDPGGVVQYPSGDPVGQALEQGGNRLQQLTERFEERRSQQERFSAFIGFDEFGAKLATEAETAKRTMEPGAIGFHEQLLKTYDERSKEWLGTIPAPQRPEFEARIRAKRESFGQTAAKMEVEESTRFQVGNIKSRLDVVKGSILQAGPDAVEPFAKDMDELLDATTLSPILKAEAKKQIRVDLQEAGFRALASRDPQAAQNVAAGWGLGAATASQRERDAVSFFTGKGLSPVAATAFVGRLSHESGGMNTTARNPADGRDGSDSIGLGQWNAERAAGLKAFAAERGKPATDFNTQLEFAWSELSTKERKALEGLQAARTPEEAARAALDYERPKGWKPDGSHRNEDVAGYSDQMRRTRSLLASQNPDARFDALPADRRLVLAGAADLELRKQTSEQATAEAQIYSKRFNDLQIGIIDNKATHADVAQARQDGWLKDAGDITRLTNAIDQRDKDTDLTRAAMSAIQTPDFVWSPFDTSHKKMAERAFEGLGANSAALETVLNKTGIVPQTAIAAMRGHLISNDVRRVESTLQAAANMIAGRPTIFTGVEGGKDISGAALAFRHYIDDRGMSAGEATKKIMEEQTPEYERNIKAKIKSEDVNAIVKKELKIGDIEHSFDQVPWIPGTDPKVGFSPEMRTRAMGDYEEIFREHYVKNGDIEKSKSLAQAAMRSTWGVTSVNGSKVVMKYPPERSPIYAGIENVSGFVAAQAVAAIKDLNGVDVDRSRLRLDEARDTADRFRRGASPTYVLSYVDNNGLVQTIPKQFYANPSQMRDEQTAKRAAESAKIQARVGFETDLIFEDGMIDHNRAPLGVRAY